jgi:hypothetical protein
LSIGIASWRFRAAWKTQGRPLSEMKFRARWTWPWGPPFVVRITLIPGLPHHAVPLTMPLMATYLAQIAAVSAIILSAYLCSFVPPPPLPSPSLCICPIFLFQTFFHFIAPHFVLEADQRNDR